LTVIGDTLAVGGGTLTAGGGTLTAGNGTLVVGGGTLMSNDQHRLGSVIAYLTQQRHHQYDSVATSCLHSQYRLSSIVVSTTQLCRHQVKQHPQDEDLIFHPMHGRVGLNKDHCLSCVYQGRKCLPSFFFIILSIFTW
jgi:hypothetical protein